MDKGIDMFDFLIMLLVFMFHESIPKNKDEIRERAKESAKKYNMSDSQIEEIVEKVYSMVNCINYQDE